MSDHNVDEDVIEARRTWFEWYAARLEQGVMKPSEPGVRYACPCCSYPTLGERGGYEICHLCNWEDDGQDDPYADEVWGGPNGAYSLTQARENFKRYGSMYGPEGAQGDTPKKRDAKRAIIEAFDHMSGEADPVALGALWQKVYESEKRL